MLGFIYICCFVSTLCLIFVIFVLSESSLIVHIIFVCSKKKDG